MAESRSAEPALSRAAIQARRTVLKRLKDDQRIVKSAARDFREHELDADPAPRERLVGQVLVALQSHLWLAREHLYPALRATVDSDRAIVRAEVGQQAIAALIGLLQAAAPQSTRRIVCFEVLCEQAHEHLRREARDILPRLQLAPLDWPTLEAAQRLRQQQPPALLVAHRAAPRHDGDDDGGGEADRSGPTPIDDQVEAPKITTAPDTPAERRAVVHGPPIK